MILLTFCAFNTHDAGEFLYQVISNAGVIATYEFRIAGPVYSDTIGHQWFLLAVEE